MSIAELHLEDQTDQTTAPGIWTSDPLPPPEPLEVTADVQCLCPHCGTFNSGVGKVCAHCDLPDNSETRSISGMRPGRWFVLDPKIRMPPMEFQELQSLAECELINARSVVRGPGTGQLWRLASSIRGLSREFGVCFSCGGGIDSDETICPHCDRSQNPVESSHARPPQASQVSAPKATPASPTPDPEPIIEQAPSGPRVHVHTLSEASEQAERDLLIRPVIASGSEWHAPMDDLLTPRDVAKAFQLEFSTSFDGGNRKTPMDSQKKIALFAAAALVTAVVVVWPAVEFVSNRIGFGSSHSTIAAANPAESVKTTAGDLYADARTAGLPMGSSTAKGSEFSSPNFKPGTFGDPIVVPDPAPSASSDDDPSVLWSAGLDAESTGNFAKAVAAYERIQSLPSNQWPPHLQVRLELARRELKGEVK